jgi:hypothetical protein
LPLTPEATDKVKSIPPAHSPQEIKAIRQLQRWNRHHAVYLPS